MAVERVGGVSGQPPVTTQAHSQPAPNQQREAGEAVAHPRGPAGYESPMSRKQSAEEQERRVETAAERLQKTADIFGHSLQFEVHKETERLMVRVLEKETGEVIREIPPEQILDAVARMRELLGLLFDERV